MNINKARKILGKSSENVSNERIQEQIDVATLIAEAILMKSKESKKNK